MDHIAAADLTPEMTIFDVRNAPELAHGHIENVTNVPLLEVYKLAE
jgi:rhodanese-related sulfurtransferase